tara:strand:+ start:1026 stop:1265 length:240 start_codon:yes stop_codon:yes gene_type:complete
MMEVKMKTYLMSVAALLTIILFLLVKEQRYDDVKAGLESCIENIQKQCGPVTDYAVLLEASNADLNKRLKTCIDSQMKN